MIAGRIRVPFPKEDTWQKETRWLFSLLALIFKHRIKATGSPEDRRKIIAKSRPRDEDLRSREKVLSSAPTKESITHLREVISRGVFR